MKLSAPEAPTTAVSSPWVVRGTVQLFICPVRGVIPGNGDVMAQALRVAGQGTAVLVVQFLKGGIHQGPDAIIHMGRDLEWVRCNLTRCIDSPHLEPEEHQAITELWHFTQSAVASGRFGLVVLDELSLAIKFGFIPETEVLDLLHQRPSAMDVVITGQEMPDALLEVADLVTQVNLREQRSAA
ncbi:MAG: P-loop NTPase family protein [Synechococcales cyanobacterium]